MPATRQLRRLTFVAAGSLIPYNLIRRRKNIRLSRWVLIDMVSHRLAWLVATVFFAWAHDVYAEDGRRVPQTGKSVHQITEPETVRPGPFENQIITKNDRRWWAFRPLEKSDVPVSQNDQWSTGAIDQFVFARLSAHQMRPAPRADKVTLARRLFLDLIGLPPTPHQIDEFVQNESPNAWEDLIDRLLSKGAIC